MNKKQEDLKMGKLNEDYIKDVISDYFKIPKLSKTDAYHPMDFYFDDTYFEVKSRNNNYNTYPTTMIGYNKIEWIKKQNINDAYFIFVFTDGDYFYKYNPDEKLECSIGGRCDRGKREYKKYYYIPIDKLIKII
jgi:hypothetical protein